MKSWVFALLVGAVLAPVTVYAADDDGDRLEIYSARGNAADEEMYADFVATTGIKLTRTENSSQATIEALKNEGGDSSADIVLLDGIVYLAEAQAMSLFKPVRSDVLDNAVPTAFRAAPTEDETTPWFGVSRNARIVVYQKDQIKPEDVASYDKLANPSHRGKLCMGSANGSANMGLLAAIIEHEGAEKAKTWLENLKSNLARAPAGDDTDQIRAVAEAKCQIGVTNQADLARLMQSDVAADRDLATSLGVMIPNQNSWGVHADVSGVAMTRHAKHEQGAVKFIEYLVSDQGQNLFANENNAWPVVESFKFDNPELKIIVGKDGDFKTDKTPLAKIATHLAAARKMIEDVRFDEKRVEP